MKLTLLEDLVCPCGRNLELTTLSAVDVEVQGRPMAEVISGWLCCDFCSEKFPIIRGVPRMLSSALLEVLKAEYPEFFRNRFSRSNGIADDRMQASIKTMRSFGYEWRYFSDIRPEGERNFRFYFEGCQPETFSGKMVLDAGCGKGRHLFYTAQYARKAIGIDLSPAVDAAFENTRHLPNAHVIQADLFRLPLRRHSFDIIYSLGVLHHLPDPEAGFRELLAYGRPGSGVIIYVYWSLNDEPSWKRRLLSAVGAVRRATVGLPFPILSVFSWIVAVGCEVIFVLPYRLLRDSRYRDFAETLPLKTYAQFPFRCLYQDQFDRFSAPIEHRYDRHEVEEWLERAGLVDIRILSGAGWRAMGRISNSSVAIERSATIK